jgi:hypothetical protein
MLAGRPHEAAGNGSPRWMTAAPRKRVHRTRPTGRLTRPVRRIMMLATRGASGDGTGSLTGPAGPAV